MEHWGKEWGVFNDPVLGYDECYAKKGPIHPSQRSHDIQNTFVTRWSSRSELCSMPRCK